MKELNPLKYVLIVVEIVIEMLTEASKNFKQSEEFVDGYNQALRDIGMTIRKIDNRTKDNEKDR
jgi:hypothetical protein